MNSTNTHSADNHTMINCPNCDHLQVNSDECAKCGVIFRKYIKSPGSFFRNVYSIKRYYLNIFHRATILSFLTGVFFFLTRNYWPGGIEIVSVIIILSFVFGTALLFEYLSYLKFSILLTDRGLKISKQPFIRWEHIYRVEWHAASYKVSENDIFPRDASWFEFFYYNVQEKRACRMIISHKVDFIYGLYSEIKRRMHASDEYLYLREISSRKLIEFGIWLVVGLAGFIYLTLIEEHEEFESVFISNVAHHDPLYAISATGLFLALGVLLALRARE